MGFMLESTRKHVLQDAKKFHNTVLTRTNTFFKPTSSCVDLLRSLLYGAIGCAGRESFASPDNQFHNYFDRQDCVESKIIIVKYIFRTDISPVLFPAPHATKAWTLTTRLPSQELGHSIVLHDGLTVPTLI